jgi:hypothetical protein
VLPFEQVILEVTMYKNLYRTNPDKGNLIIDIALDKYNDFFHEWDNASHELRDMNPELASFIEICSKDIPMSKKIEIVFDVTDDSRDTLQENFIKESFHNYYGFFLRQEKSNLNRMYIKAFLLVGISAGLLLAHGVFGAEVSNNLVPEMALEGILIGAWVFMWEAIHLVSFERSDVRRNIKAYKRFLQATVVFAYKTVN